MHVVTRNGPGRMVGLLATGALLVIASPSANAQDPARTNPRDALRGYLQACIDTDFERAARFLDLSGAAAADGPRLARHFKFVLDQKLWVDVDALSEDAAGDLEDGSERRDRVGVIESSGGPVEVLLERSDATGDWLISDQTVARIEPLYDEFGLGPLGEFLPSWMFRPIGDVEIWQWAALVLLVLVAYLVARLLAAATTRMTLRITRRTRTEIDDELVRAASAPVTATLMLILFLLGTLPLGLAAWVQGPIRAAAQGLIVLTITWFALRLVDVGSDELKRRLEARGDLTAVIVIPVVRRIAKVLLVLIAALTALQNLGFNVLTIVAGLGVVGIAVAFAAQKSIEDFFGFVKILIDQPVKPGDFCRFGDKTGTVEDIGWWSTRVRTGDRTVITIPNSEFAALQLENFRFRDRIRFHTILGLRYETSADQLRHVLIGLKELLVRHPRVHPDPARIRFVGFGAFSLDLELNCYVDTSDWNEFLAIREDLMLRIIELVDASGTGFAFPSQTLYMASDTGLDSERAKHTEREVEELRRRRELCLPEFPPERLRELEGTLDYPPTGSAVSSTEPGTGAED